MSCRRKPWASFVEHELGRDPLRHGQGELRDARGMRRGLAEVPALVVVELQRARKGLHGGRGALERGDVGQVV